jgi:RNA polymerase sigma-70 factor (ECF subfamily)
MNESTMSDAELMQHIAAGDERALSALMHRHGGYCFRLALRITGQRDSADDVVQETFMRVWQNAARWQAPDLAGARFTTWLYRVVSNLAIDELRRRKQGVFSMLDDSIADSGESPERKLAVQDDAKEVSRALDALPERQRVAFVLCFYEEKTNQQAADIMGVNLKAFEGLLVRARRHLRERLGYMKKEIGHE